MHTYQYMTRRRTAIFSTELALDVLIRTYSMSTPQAWHLKPRPSYLPAWTKLSGSLDVGSLHNPWKETDLVRSSILTPHTERTSVRSIDGGGGWGGGGSLNLESCTWAQNGTSYHSTDHSHFRAILDHLSMCTVQNFTSQNDCFTKILLTVPVSYTHLTLPTKRIV